jgi:hypothetical protein
MSAAALTAHGATRDSEFYRTALTYGHYLWQQGKIARAILKLDRAFGANLAANDPILREWPLPYAALAWMMRKAAPDSINGNLRVHFQHLADRMNEPRREQRRWRAWACWGLTRAIRPELAGDSRHDVKEPSLSQIGAHLAQHGLPGEEILWRDVMDFYLFPEPED